MKTIILPAFAKVNLSLDVLGKRDDGYHEVEMVMHQLCLRDTVTVSWHPKGEQEILLSCDKVAADTSNIAYKAAELMREHYPEQGSGSISITIEKKIPVAAGMAGGSADGAAVILGLAHLWELSAPLDELMGLGKELGADVPFCIMGQVAAGSNRLPVKGWENASVCALAQGIGELLTPLSPLKSMVLLSKPKIQVSTASIYRGLSLSEITARPNTEIMMQGLRENNLYKITENMINVLETVTFRDFPVVGEEKQAVEALGTATAVLMSGSGPTIFALYHNRKKAKRALNTLSGKSSEVYLTAMLSNRK